MLKDTLAQLFERDIKKLIEEIKLYKDENNLWLKRGSISNSAGNLTLHIIGNLNHFVGFALGNTGYIRQRDAEFSTQFAPREELILGLQKTIDVVVKTLSNISSGDLDKAFPIEKQGTIFSTYYMLLHLFGHLSYHLGQINYHRRIIEG